MISWIRIDAVFSPRGNLIWSSLLSSCPRGCQWLGECDQHRLVTINQWLNHGQYFCTCVHVLFTISGFIQRNKNKKFTKKCQFWKYATNSVQSPRPILWGKGHGRPCYYKGWTWGAQHLAWGHCQNKIRTMPKSSHGKKHPSLSVRNPCSWMDLPCCGYVPGSRVGRGLRWTPWLHRQD